MSKRTVQVVDASSGQGLIQKARWCSSFWCKFLGFQFRRKLRPGEALVMVYPRDSIRSTSIHMFFVFTPLAVIWVDGQSRVTHAVRALPWHPYYASPQPARYVIEADPGMLESVHPGEEINFVMSQ
jgi:uncharacterized membrane protein (UPF0127 family)